MTFKPRRNRYSMHLQKL